MEKQGTGCPPGAAEREYKNTISCLEDVPQKEIEESLEGYSKDTLLFICRKNLEKIKKSN